VVLEPELFVRSRVYIQEENSRDVEVSFGLVVREMKKKRGKIGKEK
jgi:hypothetical protein